MKRLLSLAALAVFAAACGDQQPLASGRAPTGLNAVALASGVDVDPVLSSALSLAAPTDQLEGSAPTPAKASV